MRCMILAAIAGLAATGAHAEGMARFGLGGGQAEIDMDDYDVTGDGKAWEVFGGWEFNRYIALEAGYLWAPSIKDHVTVEGVDVTLEADTSAIYASVLGSLPLGESFSLYGRAGYMHWESEQEASALGQRLSLGEFDGNDPVFGAGLAVNWDSALLRFEYRIASLDDSDISAITLAMAWRF